MAMVADEERRLISKRTNEALAAAKARGVQLGGNRGSIISAEAREISCKARLAASEGRTVDLAPVIAGTPGSRRGEPGRACQGP
jgi:DNA invertase Pin-like site-specific DNA recombinase